MPVQKSFLFIAVLLVGGLIMCKGNNEVNKTSAEEPCRILLLGASVGKEWNFPKWPERMQKRGYIFEMRAAYSFDKSEALEEILMRPKRKFRLTKRHIKSYFKPSLKKPDVIIFKECAAYFPGDMENYKNLVKKWVDQCRENMVKPVLATIIPVTEKHSRKRLNRLKEIIEYNEWIKKYSISENIFCLDLEVYLIMDNEKRWLKPDLADEDGLHLNKKAYKILDNMLLEKLEYISNK